MTTVGGSVILNGITNKEMEIIWAHKAKHQDGFSFSPNGIQQTAQAGKFVYNNVVFGYNSVHQLNLIAEVVNELHKREHEAKAAAQ